MAKGVGMGPELMGMLKEIFYCANAPIRFEELDIRDEEAEAEADFNNILLSIMRNGVAIKGNIEKDLRPVNTPKNIELNHRLDLYTNVMEFKSFPGVKHRNAMGSKLDITVVRQNTEGEYAMLEHDLGAGAVEHLKVTTRANTDRLARFAFKFATQNNKARVITVYNKGVHEQGETLFVETCSNVAKLYPAMKHKVQTVGSFLRTISGEEYRKNVIIASSLCGELITCILSGYIGGSALVSCGNLGERYAVFEPGARQRGLKLMGLNTCNPTSMMMAGVSMLRHLKHNKHADIIEQAVHQTINVDQVLTQDIGGKATTRDIIDNVLKHLKQTVLTGHCS